MQLPREVVVTFVVVFVANRGGGSVATSPVGAKKNVTSVEGRNSGMNGCSNHPRLGGGERREEAHAHRGRKREEGAAAKYTLAREEEGKRG